MPVLLSISATDLDDESLQELTRRLCRDLRDEASVLPNNLLNQERNATWRPSAK